MSTFPSVTKQRKDYKQLNNRFEELTGEELVREEQLTWSNFVYLYLNKVLPKTSPIYLYATLVASEYDNRLDWNDGYEMVQEWLDDFGEDLKKIAPEVYDEIIDIVEDDEFVDGRAFRDGEYNYKVLANRMIEEINKDTILSAQTKADLLLFLDFDKISDYVMDEVNYW